MAQFNFTLQIVLDQREREEKLIQMEYAKAQLAQKTLEQELATVESDLVAANEYMRDHQLVGKIDTQMIATHRRYLISARMQVIAIAQKLSTARLASEGAQRKLAAAAKDRKSIELLRDRHKARWMAEQNKKELALADDVAMQIAYQNLTDDAFAAGVQ